MIERFFEPEREFVYYEPNKLEESLENILKNYKSYEPVIENAFQKANSQYTTEKFFEKYLKNMV